MSYPLLHCVDFSDMDDITRAGLQELLENVFSREVFVITTGKTFLGKQKTTHLKISGMVK